MEISTKSRGKQCKITIVRLILGVKFDYRIIYTNGLLQLLEISKILVINIGNRDDKISLKQFTESSEFL